MITIERKRYARFDTSTLLPEEEPPVRRMYTRTGNMIHLVVCDEVDGKLYFRRWSICGSAQGSPRWFGLEDEVEHAVAWTLPLCQMCRDMWRKRYGLLRVRKLLGKSER